MCVYASMNIFGIWHDPERRLRRFKDLFLFWLCLCGVGLSLSLSSECRNTNGSVAGRLVLSPTVQFTSFGRGMVAPSIELLRCLQDSTSFEGFQPWRELACDDFCQLAWLFRRYSWHVQWDLEVWSYDCWCIGALPQCVRMSNHINSQMGGKLEIQTWNLQKNDTFDAFDGWKKLSEIRNHLRWNTSIPSSSTSQNMVSCAAVLGSSLILPSILTRWR